MGRRFYNLKLLKYFSIFVFITVVHWSGLLIHFFELDYDRFFLYPLENKPHSGKYGKYRNTSYSFVYEHNCHSKCNTSGEKPKLLFLIKSAINHAGQRDIIRRTWGREHRFSDVIIKRVFVVGMSPLNDLMQLIDEEAAAHQDIIQANFIDTYFNNTLKVMAGISWAVKYCPHSNYYMFVDDDYYVSSKNVLRYLSYHQKQNRNNPQHNLFAGFVFHTTPHRHLFSKWYVSLKEYPFSKWPPYVTAGAFILSNNVLFRLHDVSKNTAYFRFDDVYLGILALKADITLTHCEKFYFEKPNYHGPKSYSEVIASHGFSNMNYMEKVWNECYRAVLA